MLILTPNTISEAGGTSTVTARLDRASRADTTVTVRDGIRYKLGANAELTIPAGQTAREPLIKSIVAEQGGMDGETNG